MALAPCPAGPGPGYEDCDPMASPHSAIRTSAVLISPLGAGQGRIPAEAQHLVQVLVLGRQTS